MATDNLPLQYKVLCAGSSACFAELMSFPLDTAKVRLQIQGEAILNASGNQVILRNGPTVQYHGLMNTISTIVKHEGFKSLFNGLTAGLQRQICFASIRIGFYDSAKQFYQNQFYGDGMTGIATSSRIAAGITTGGMAVLIAQPTDVVKVRFQASAGRASNVRYKSTREAYKTIVRTEGVSGLWKGTLPSAGRNSIVNVAEIVVYDMIKSGILSRGLMNDSTPCHFVSAAVAGFCGTTVASPIDVVKTRYMNSSAGAYKSAVHCAIQTFKDEGVEAFFKGFFPSFCRLVSWNIVMWITYEKTKNLIVSNPVIVSKPKVIQH